MSKLTIFDLDNTLLAGDSDRAWGQYIVEKEIVSDDFLIESFDINIVITLFSVTAIFFCLLLFIWKKGLAVYSSASS